MTESNLAKRFTYDQLLTIRVELNRAKRHYESLIGVGPSQYFSKRVHEIEEILSILESCCFDLVEDEE